MSLIARPARPLLGLAFAMTLASCAATTSKPTAVEANVTTRAVGYLDSTAVPASLLLVPAPPAAGSAGFALDEQVSREARALRGTPRFAQATRDAELGFPEGANQFSCAIDVDVDAVKTPALYRLLERSRIDASAATKAAKNHYQRPRPFMVNGEPTCTPDDEAGLRKNGSYPSGHTSIGWAWALILSEIAPDRADAIQARGRNYGESRLVCNVHWQSDILEGRFMGAAAVARLHDNAAFQQDLLAARREIAAARKAGQRSARDCAAEEAVLKVRPQSAL
ncbi:phosphatase PAP2 family protein [Stenotrophomonas sp. YAU14D1_LEIMI4_1]|uniref:acid phosphatase n=1 Tax=Stenotrophomonas sp. YAU14D1_LEIMI4_1 TaxID=2072407 RepID=UPI000D540B45|nr:phosphatase PAP2 family protein [Stenotrophomonas sp. YAU14D1_LEIMI4_1]AWH23680.1 phosphatase [Stenotrophomonas sp. YAU14D1_LEIMI4_1]